MTSKLLTRLPLTSTLGDRTPWVIRKTLSTSPALCRLFHSFSPDASGSGNNLWSAAPTRIASTFSSGLLGPIQRRGEGHWSENWERDERKAKRRWTNEGFYFQTMFTRKTAKELWKGVQGSSNAARKAGGRGKRGTKTRRVDLNRGQRIGEGRTPLQIPGFNAYLEQKIQSLPPDPERQAKLIELRSVQSNKRKLRQTPLERGWTSAKYGGRKLGPPDPIGDQTFEDFETWILQSKRVSHMSGTVGRAFSFSCLAVTGNGKGLAGFGRGKSNNINNAHRKAKNQAILRLQYMKLYDNHTVFHKSYSKFHGSHLFIEPRPRGHGLRCHRVLKVICQAIGIKDLWARVEHSTTNYLAITQGFFRALRAQKDIQQLADEMRLYAVEYRAENDNFPVLIAAPRPEVGPARRDAEIGTEEYRDLDLVLNDGKLCEFPEFIKPPYVFHSQFYLNRDRWIEYKRRNQPDAFIRRHVLFSDEYPEPFVVQLGKQENDNEEDEKSDVNS